MSRFLQGLFVGISISLLTALMLALTKSEILRRQLGKRIEELRNALPESEQLKLSAQKAARKVQKTRSILSNLIQQSADRITQSRQEDVSTAQQTAQSVEQSEQTSGTTSSEGPIYTLATPGAD